MKPSEKFIVMNWKCNPASISEVKALIATSDVKNVVICPPAPFLGLTTSLIKNASLGAQDGYFTEGAYTGEYSFKQLKSIGVKYAIIGHSERRQMFGESSEDIARKTASALLVGISPIVCVGEKTRTSLAGAVKKVLSQLEDSLAGVPKDKVGKIILAYEPVWAISTTDGGKGSASLSEVAPIMEAMAVKFSELFNKKTKVLYGGSVNPENVSVYAECESIHGVLIGSASLDKKKVSELIKLIKIK